MPKTQYHYQIRVAGSAWRTETTCKTEEDILSLMIDHGITTLRCDTPEGMLEVLAVEE